MKAKIVITLLMGEYRLLLKLIGALNQTTMMGAGLTRKEAVEVSKLYSDLVDLTREEQS